MYNIASIVGARPQFIKAFITIRSINKVKNLNNTLVHTGQHFDYSMSNIFFKELKFSQNLIKINLKYKNDRILRLSEMISKLYLKLKKIKPDLIIVYGDTDSTLAASIVSKRLDIKLMHIEAGLRSNDIDMPEEQNRFITDYLSNYLIAPTKSALENLKPYKNIKKIYNLGDVMFDSINFYKKIINNLYLKKFKKKNNLNNKYIFFSIHRDSNTGVKKVKTILNQISQINQIFFWPIHPKIYKIIKKNNLKIPKNIIGVDPLSYLDTIAGIKASQYVVTDSGGIQKESYFMKKKCFVLRNETEWNELIKLNSLKLVGNNLLIINKSKSFLKSKIKNSREFGSGNSTKKITLLIQKLLKKNEKK
jgi:UDP-GlcNAc3NAcA epimerase